MSSRSSTTVAISTRSFLASLDRVKGADSNERNRGCGGRVAVVVVVAVAVGF
jgi:hypothetical protein